MASEEDYCVLCQEGHKMSDSCIENVQCKMCGKKGHLRIDCPGQNLISHLEEDDGYQSTSKDFPKEGKDGSHIGSYFGPGDEDLATRRGIKRKICDNSTSSTSKVVRFNSGSEPFVSNGDPRNVNKVTEGDQTVINHTSNNDVEVDNLRTPLMTSCIKPLDSPEFGVANEDLRIGRKASTTTFISLLSLSSDDECEEDFKDLRDFDSNADVICISDDENQPEPKDNTTEGEFIVLSEWKGLEQDSSVSKSEIRLEESAKIPELTKQVKSNLISKLEIGSKCPQLVELKQKEKKSPMIQKGMYPIISVHIEISRSNKSPSTKLTQIGCIASGLKDAKFFKAIKPSGLEKYLDSYKLGGDLLQALHMTREDDGTFLFRSQFEIVEDGQKIVCVEESEALKGFLDFIENFPNCVLLGVDEDTVSIIVKKLKEVNKEKFRQLVKGFTYWKRLLKYLKVGGYRNIDLEEYYTQMVQRELPSFNRASDIAEVLLKAAMEVTSKKEKYSTKHFYKLCKRIECLEHPIRVEYDRKASVENVEVFSSFRPSVSATFRAEKLEQITLSSESDSEPEETGRRRSYSCSEGSLNDNIEVLNETLTNQIIVKSKGLNINQWVKPDERTLPAAETPALAIPGLPPMVFNYWQIGKPTKNEGTVLCPSIKCKLPIRYSNISKHLKKVHLNLVDLANLLCHVCKRPVLPSLVVTHMPKCNATSGVPNYIIPRQPKPSLPAPQPAVSHTTPFILPGMTVLPSLIDSRANWLKSKFQHYLLTNFTPCAADSKDNIKCDWMFMNYQKNIQKLGEKVVYSPTMFMQQVEKVALDKWKIVVGPFMKIQKGHRIGEKRINVMSQSTWNNLFLKVILK